MRSSARIIWFALVAVVGTAEVVSPSLPHRIWRRARWQRSAALGSRSAATGLEWGQLQLLRGGADNVGATEDGEGDEVSEQDEESGDDEEGADGEEEEAAESDRDTDAIVPNERAVPLRLDETLQDKALRATQAVGAVLGRHHARLAKNPSIGFLISNPMIIQLVCVVGLMQLSKRFNYQDPKTLRGIRLWYTGSQLLMQFVYHMLKLAIIAADDQTEVVEPLNPLLGKFMNMSTPSEGATGESPALAGLTSALAKKPTTAKEYDLKLVKQEVTSQFVPMLIMYVLHFKAEWHKAIVMSPVSSLLQLFSGPMFQIHILGREATGDLARPFKSGMEATMAKMQEAMQPPDGLEDEGGDDDSTDSDGGNGAADEGSLDE